MYGYIKHGLVAGIVAVILVGCQSRPTEQGQQYKDGQMTHDLEWVSSPNTRGKPINGSDYLTQVQKIQGTSSSLFNRNAPTYQAVERWLKNGGQARDLAQFGLDAYQMEGKDGFGNVQFTGYYTPLLQARHTKQGEFRYPLYRMPPKGKRGRLPSRAAIHQGALSEKYVLSYSNSLMDNFMMEVQGSGYVDFGDGQPPVFYSYAGKNGHGYYSIGKVLIDRGEVPKEEMSMQAIRQWASRQPESEVRKLLEQNPSYVFFQPKVAAPVKGASGIPLIAKASVAADKTLIPPGSTLLAEIPLLDKQGKFTGKYQMRLVVALDVGGAIKGHHFDVYQGIGEQAGEMAGFYNHYGRVWLLQAEKNATPMFNVYRASK